MMRIVMLGDKSRYHFFRSIVDLDMSNNQESIFTERLGEREVFMTSDYGKTKDGFFYSPRIPLNTELFFPPELSSIIDLIKDDDKVIWFDEFPYTTDGDIERLKEIISAGKSNQIVIVLFSNARARLVTDISTDDMALEDAISRYSQFNLSIYKYTLNELPYFLLWQNDSDGSGLERTFPSMVKTVTWNLEVFDSSYEYMMDFPGESGNSIASFIEFDILARFCDYDQKLNKNSIWKIYHEKAYNYYWKNNYEVLHFCKFIYKDAIEPVCVWDFEQDFECLYFSITESFKQIIADMKSLKFKGEKADYDEFLKNNQERIVNYKTRIQHFFREEMREIIKARIRRNLCKLEGLFSC
ncbi:hypothetical protein [Butyrivibrio sp. LC3010]|uniref:hypothetical protein n=1 Tax=Butyrivibrio sp. LC3010 TaxID=1280680 RepID=UPI00041B50AA|nr:hypothetical protein [Butyrivibrio sp. LC3010]